ncbi:MAG: hypothetical protein AAGF35_04310 [Pseudomonadota bacterium]
MPANASDSTLPPSLGRRGLLFLVLIFVLALLPRFYSAVTLGWDWDWLGSFSLVNFDEGGSCRSELEGFSYSTFIGKQTIAIATAVGSPPPEGIAGDARAVKGYCHSREHIRVARVYSAVTGSLTCVVLALIGLLLVPGQPGVAWSAGILLALSGFHISESHSGTVDAPSVFFIYSFIALMIWSVKRHSVPGLLTSPLLLVPAIWTKYWVFAVFSYLAWLPSKLWNYVSHGMSGRRVVLVMLATCILGALLTNPDFKQAKLYPVLVLWYLVIPWRAVHKPMAGVWLLLPLIAWLLFNVDLIAKYTTGGEYGTAYAAIGWHKLLRNLVNIPFVLIVGLGLPAFLFIPWGIRALTHTGVSIRAWVCLSPVLIFLLFMAFLAPVTYYRHYLPLLPAAALLSALGLYATRWAQKRWFSVLFFAWPALLAFDLLLDYHQDPRIELRQWYIENPDARVFTSFYVNPPAGNNHLFRPEYADGDAGVLRQATHLILSENWYDTAFANELNGPLTHDLTRLVKTEPSYARFYRDALAGRHPHLEVERTIALHSVMPELRIHRWLYGNFPLFVGDLVIFRVKD